jgi:hypothetical protein
MIVTTSALVLLAACGGGGNNLESLGPPPEASPTGNVPPAATSPTSATGGTGTTITDSGGPVPTTSPGITGSVNVGNATITVSGGLQTSQPTLPLASPAIYAPPPGTFTLAWSTAAAGFALGGTSFVGTTPTSATLRLTFYVHSASGTASFASDDGGCDVTVTTAAATAFDGTFSCSGVSDASGTVVVNAQGTFSASE